MTASAEQIVIQALELSPQARAFVAERLIESLNAAPGAELSPAWRAEIQKRCRDVDPGSVELRCTCIEISAIGRTDDIGLAGNHLQAIFSLAKAQSSQRENRVTNIVYRIQ